MPYLFTSEFVYGWGLIFWFGILFLLLSGAGNWGYSYRAHRKFDSASQKDASAILNERYARGELTRAQYLEQKTDIAAT
tara:strand:+ start:426 stop:662 length:237 start_codon:yes stop_codon:yes gene_type:complete